MKKTNLTNVFDSRPELKPLEMFVGSWHTEGKMKGEAGGRDVTIKGTDIYEWVSGGHFLLHRVNVLIGSQRVETTELIGYDSASKTYAMHYFDSEGKVGYMSASVTNGKWVFQGESLRFAGSFSADGSKLSGKWENYSGTQWLHFMDIELTKV